MMCPTCHAQNPPHAINCLTCGSPLPSPYDLVAPTPNIVSHSPALQRGTKLKGIYSIDEVLGQGGFGLTYRAGDTQLRRFVAIKEFFPFGATRQGTKVNPPHGTSLDQYATLRRNFLSEAQVLARFSHPGIVRVFDAFEANDTAYMVMELIEGISLGDVLQQNGVMPQEQALRIITQIGEALQAVHDTGLLHRDIKPDNILLTGQKPHYDRSILIDFGTARKFTNNQTSAMTAQLTPGYAPLEQYGQQARFGPFTDVYALGGTLYHMLTGRAPVAATDRLNGVDLPSPQHLNPQISAPIAQAILRALEVRAPDRPQSVRAFLSELQNVAFTEPVPYPPAPTQPPPVVPSHSFPRQPTPPKERSALPDLAVFAFVVISATLYLSNYNSQSPAPNSVPLPTPMAWPTPAPWPTPVPTLPPIRSATDNTSDFTDSETYNQGVAFIKEVFAPSTDIDTDPYGSATSYAWTRVKGIYWAEGRLRYYGRAAYISVGTQQLYLEGRDSPKGQSTVKWLIQMSYSPSEGWDVLSLEMNSV